MCYTIVKDLSTQYHWPFLLVRFFMYVPCVTLFEVKAR
jgi:hypothetical protein